MRMLILAALAAVAAGAPALAADIPPDLARAVHDYDQAQIHSDRAELERMLADDYTLVSSSGQVETKPQFIADQVAPGYRLDPFTVEKPVEKVWADGAVMGGVAQLSGTDGGKPFKTRLRFSDVWAKRGGVWRVIYTHASRAPD